MQILLLFSLLLTFAQAKAASSTFTTPTDSGTPPPTSCVKTGDITWTDQSSAPGPSRQCKFEYRVNCKGTRNGKEDKSVCAEQSIHGDASTAHVYNKTENKSGSTTVDYCPHPSSQQAGKCRCATGVADCVAN